MKRVLIVAGIVTLMTDPAGAESQYERDLETYNAVWSRGLQLWRELYERDGRAWRVAYLLEECGYPVPAGLSPTVEQVTDEVIHRARSVDDLELTFQIVLVVQAVRTGYLLGMGTTRQLFANRVERHSASPPTDVACRKARETAEDIVALRAHP